MSDTLTADAFAFDDALRLEALGPRRWGSQIDKRYWNSIGPFGGWTVALLLKAVLAEADHAGTPVALTVNLMGGLNDEPISLVTRPVRQGRSMEFWTCELHQGDAVAAMAMVTLGQRRDTYGEQEAAMPAVPMPEEVPPPKPHVRVSFGMMFENRAISGPAPFQPTDDGSTLTRTWVRDAQARPLDYPLAAMLADVFAPRLMYKITERSPVSTISMSAYFHATPAELAAVGTDYVMAEAKARRFESGFFDQTGSLWSRDGKLLVTTEQLSWFK